MAADDGNEPRKGSLAVIRLYASPYLRSIEAYYEKKHNSKFEMDTFMPVAM